MVDRNASVSHEGPHVGEVEGWSIEAVPGRVRLILRSQGLSLDTGVGPESTIIEMDPDTAEEWAEHMLEAVYSAR